MKPRAHEIAQKLMNLYRQEHVIFGGWAAVNAVFVKEATDDVLDELQHLPTGKSLIKHIKNLRSGKTKMDSIERDLMPYGGAMSETVASVPLTEEEWEQLEKGIDNFIPTQEGLNTLQQLPVIKQFEDEWIVAIHNALKDRPDLLEKWSVVTKTYRAYHLWDVATSILNEPVSERVRAQLQADMPEYETYLPMFGQSGDELLAKLRTFLTVREPFDTDNAPDNVKPSV